MLEKELRRLHSAIAESTDSLNKFDEVDLSKAFKEARKTEETLSKETAFDQKERQAAIFDFIRQLPNGCRMRDLVREFPEVREREP